MLWLGVVLALARCAAEPQEPCPPGALSLQCRQRCEKDGDCVAPAVCDRLTRRCLSRPIACDPAGPEAPDGGMDGEADGGAARACPRDKECDLLTRTCVPRAGAACESSGDCRPGEVCGDGSCAPDPQARTCQRDGDCAAQLVCRLTVTDEGELRPVCGPPLGPAPAGARCEDNAECQTGICLLSGVCYGGCARESVDKDCYGQDGVLCGKVVFSVGDGFATVPSCTLAAAPCKADKDCVASGGVCGLITDPLDPAKLIGSCGPPRGPARAGGPCHADGDCATALCLSTYCYDACATATDCRPGFACRAQAYAIGDTSGSIGTCLPARPCQSRFSCPAADEICAAQPNAAETDLELVCTPGAGKNPGEACAQDEDCKSGVCIEPGICAGGCGVDLDCPKGPQGETELCRPLDLTVGGVEGTPRSCQLRPAACERDADCARPGQICRAFRSLDDPARIAPGCGSPVNPGKAAPGAGCALSADCQSGFCMSFTQPPVCYGLCKGDGDCPAGRRCYAGYVPFLTSGTSGQIGATYDATSACAPDLGSRRPCLGDGAALDCPAGEVCVPLPDAPQLGWSKRCQRPAGAGKGGAACTDGKECQTGRCQLLSGTRRCLGLCAVGGAAVCAAGTTCKPGALEVRSGRSASLTYCQ